MGLSNDTLISDVSPQRGQALETAQGNGRGKQPHRELLLQQTLLQAALLHTDSECASPQKARPKGLQNHPSEQKERHILDVSVGADDVLNLIRVRVLEGEAAGPDEHPLAVLGAEAIHHGQHLALQLHHLQNQGQA